jgi:fibronectin type 3 domain-containing protein
MIKKAVLFLSMLMMAVLFLLCVNTPNPFNPDNAKIYLVLKDSKGLVDINQPVTEAVTDSVWIGVCAYLKDYIDSVAVTVNNGAATEAQFTIIKKFVSDLDTIWHAFAFSTTGTRVVIATPYINGKKEKSLQGNVTIIGKAISAGISPKTASIKEDSSVTFVVNVTGTGPIAYQWYHNDTAISAGGTSQAYAIKPAAILNSGSYKCKVTDQWGDSVFSDTATLTVFKPNVKPVLSISMSISRLKILTTDTCLITISVTDPDSGQTDSISVVKAPDGYAFKDFLFTWVPPAGYLGTDSVRIDSVIFAVIDNGTPRAVDTLRAKIEVRLTPVNFSVLYNGNGNTSGTVPVDANAYVPGTAVTVKGNTGVLAKTGFSFAGWNTKSDGSGTSYAVGATLTMGTANDTLLAMWTLTIPIITTEPGDKSVVVGQTATFSVVATGAGLKYQWQKGTTNLAGDTSASFTTPATTLADSGSTYRCIVSNPAGKDTSIAAVLTVTTSTVAAVVTTDPANQSVAEGATATFTVVASGTSPQYQWQKGTTNILNATAASYTTPATTITDSGSTYRCIVSNTAGKDTSASAMLVVLRLPQAPVISGITTGDGTATVTWSAVTGATSYNLYYIAGATVNKTNGTKVTGAASPKTVSTLTNGTQHAFAVSTVNANGESALSTVQTATPQVPAAGAPVISSATAGNAKVTLTWGAVTGATSYNLYYAAGTTVDKTGTKIAGTTSPSDVTGLTNGTAYAFAVSAVNAGGESALSTVRTATPQVPAAGAPTISSATAGNAKVTVAWGAVTGATSYNLYYAAGTTVDKTGTKVAGATSPSDVTGLTNGTQYAFAASAVNAGGESALSTVQTATPQVPAPGAPTISSATAGNTLVTVAWGTVTGATSYNIYYAAGTTVDKSGTKMTVVTSPRDITGLTNGTPYAFAMSAVNAGGESALSGVLTATPQVPAPGAPTISAATSGSSKVTVSWSAVTGATSYNIYYKAGSTVDKTGTKVSGVTSPSDVTGLTNGTGYAFAVSAVNAGGESGLSGVLTATPQVPAPGAPTISAATSGNTKVTVSWSAVTGATSYNLYYTAGSTVDKNGLKITGVTSPRDVTSLTNGTQYAFAVSAVNAGGESGLSGVLTATPQVPAPAAPTIGAAAAGNTKVTVSWTAVTGATSYNLYYIAGSTVDKTGTKVTGVTSPYDVTNLTNGTQYAFALSAVNAGGESALSSVVTSTPPLTVGQSYQGGIIAYIDGTGKHGMIAPAADVTPTTYYEYGCVGSLLGAGGSVYGTGASNTTTIHANCSDAPAATLCYNLILNGYEDWVLPSKDEFNILITIPEISGTMGAVYYWSSTETDADHAYVISPGGSVYPYYKSQGAGVRPIRYF